MVRQDAGTARLARARPGAPLTGRWRGLFATGVLAVDLGHGVEVIDDGTLLWTDDERSPPWRPGAGTSWCLTLD